MDSSRHPSSSPVFQFPPSIRPSVPSSYFPFPSPEKPKLEIVAFEDLFWSRATMPPEVSSQWREKASGFFSSSGVRLKQAGQSAGTLAKNAGVNVADAAGKVGSLLKNRWTLIQQSMEQQTPTASGESMQQSFLSAATSTGALLKKGIAETKKKAFIEKLKVEEMDAHNLSVELAPVILHQKGDTRADLYCHFFYTSKDPSATMEHTSNQNTLVDYLDEDDNDYASSQISLDDVLPPDYGAVEVIQWLIEHHNAIFTDANETTWR